jgi:membrane-associated phospholipid phosphatase
MRLVRLRAFAGWKAFGAGSYGAGLAAYEAIQVAGRGRSVVVPWSSWDEAVPVLPLLLPVYLLQLALVGLPFLFIDDFWYWRRAVIGLAAVSTIAMLIHMLWPTMVLRPESGSGMLHLLRRFDGSGNALPSLHAACAVYVAVMLHGFSGLRWWALLIAWTWVALVLFACVSLRQHTVLDVLTGALLGAGGAVLAGVGRPTRSA